MAPSFTAEQIAIYRATARRRQADEQEALALRQERAWAVARQAAVLLRERFGAGRVAVFGSLVHPELFHARSDIDLAVWGLDERQIYRAVAALLALDPAIDVDLVRAEEAAPALGDTIAREGVPM